MRATEAPNQREAPICLDPITLTALAIAGSVASAGGAIYSGQAADKQGKYEQAVANENAKSERMRGQYEADRVEDRYDKLRGQQAAGAAASGINPNAGSAALVINQDTSRNEYLDVASTIWNADSAATAFEHQGEAARLKGKNAKTASYFNAAGNFLSGMGNAGRVRGSTSIS